MHILVAQPHEGNPVRVALVVPPHSETAEKVGEGAVNWGQRQKEEPCYVSRMSGRRARLMSGCSRPWCRRIIISGASKRRLTLSATAPCWHRATARRRGGLQTIRL